MGKTTVNVIKMVALIVILIAFYIDSKSETKSTFLSDLKGGLFICSVFIIYAIVLRYAFNVGSLIIVFSIGVELILLFVIKAALKNKF